MDRSLYRSLSPQLLSQAFPLGQATDTVTVTITNLTTAAVDTAATAMTNVTATSWTYAWTPALANLYLIDYYNQTLEVHYYEYAQIVGVVPPSAGGVVGSSSLQTLRVKLLKLLDNYNANDLSGTNSSGEIADLCINDALQLIYALIKDSTYMQAYPSTNLVSVIDQEYIDIGGITDADRIVTIRDTTNNMTLECIPYWVLRQEVPNPAQNTGIPIRYARLFGRVYLSPRPTSVIIYTSDYIKFYPQLTANSDTALIPSHYDDWIMKEAMVKWYMMEDKDGVPALAVSERDQARVIYRNDIMSEYDLTPEAQSHWNERGRVQRLYQRPVG